MATIKKKNFVSGDSFATKFHQGKMISTFDQDNALYHINCAETYHNAWWMGGCFTCSLTGPYSHVPSVVDYAKGRVWSYDVSYGESLEFAEMRLCR